MKSPFVNINNLLWPLALMGMFVCFPVLAFDDNVCEPQVSRLVSAQGNVDVSRALDRTWHPAEQGQLYCGDDKVRTGALSRALLSLEQGIATFLALDQLTLLNFVKNAGRVMLSVERGQVHVRSHTPSRFDVSTPFVNAGIEGTEFLIAIDQNHAEITVFQGKVRVYNDYGEIMIGKGQTALTDAGSAPVLKQIDIVPEDAVRWALYYPPLVDFGSIKSLADNPDIAVAGERYQAGDVLGAISQIDGALARQPSAELYGLQAGLLLTVGRVDDAESMILKAKDIDPNNTIADALKAMVALTKNDNKAARILVQSAVNADPNSSIAFSALSYVEQADFDIVAALAATDKALALSPQNALNHCRRAELLASLGEIGDAQKSAETALSLNPRLARTHAILGYTQLMNANIDASEVRFRRAIELDAGDPLVRFGLALVLIRRNDLAAGIEQLEIAASLDPNDALIRSYLGKAYYDQHRATIAQSQFDLAKKYDPQDPTPHFYEAIAKQTSNQPTQALEAINEAVRLNDNRAVYRSRQLLDQDLAARSASLARIYNDLDFEKLAYNEASKSVLMDPTNFSAHRFLADTYAGQPRHQIARVSEVLQMQLWQPNNVALIQPQLNDAGINLPQSGGNQYLTFREFNPLFNRDGARFQTSGLLASNQTYANDAVLNYQRGRLGLSLSQFHYQTNGYRPNNDQDQNLYDALVQFNLSSNTSVQVEYRRNESRNGDITNFNFRPDDNMREMKNRDTWRLGFRHAFSSYSAVIANLSHLEDMEDESSSDYSDKVTDSTNSVEFQHVFNLSDFKLITGFGSYHSSQIWDSQFIFEEVDTAFRSKSFAKTQNNNAYIYSIFNFASDLYATVGSSIDQISDESLEKTTINPKLGFTWLPSANTSLRFAAFKTQKRSFVNDQTIEPTQVAGFNQFFDDPDGMESWRFGAGIDQKVMDKMFIGYEWSKREIEFPSDLSELFGGNSRFNEYAQRAYWNFVLMDGVSTYVDYQYNNLMIDPESQLITHKIPFGLSLFDPRGLSLKINPIFVDQYYEGGGHEGSSSKFMSLNLSLSYRLPKRLGMLSLGVMNVTGEKFSYRTTDLQESTLIPDRWLFSHLTLYIQ